MRTLPLNLHRSVLVATALGVLLPLGVWAGEAGDAPAAASQRTDPCGFYRGQAFGRGLAHFSTEMLWACEAITMRRTGAVDLSERLAAVERALERYRAAVIAEGSAAFARGRARGPMSQRLGADETVKAALAERTGALAALEAVRSGF